MKAPRILLTIAPLSLLASCNSLPEPASAPANTSPPVQGISSQLPTPNTVWSVANVRAMDGDANESDLYLLVNGQSHQIATKVPSLKDAQLGGPLKADELNRLGAISGYSFEWHVSGDTFFVKREGNNLAVFVESWGDENEGASSTRRLKTIAL